MRELVLIAATAMEMRAVAEGLGVDLAFGQVEPVRFTHASGRDIRFILSGVGPLAAAFTAGKIAGEGLLSPKTCAGVLCLGIAGTYVPGNAPLGSVVKSTRETWPEYGLVTEAGIDPVALGFPLAGKKDDPAPVWDSVALDPLACEHMGLNDPLTVPALPENPRVVAGPGITVAGVSGTRTRARELAARYTAFTENMEGFPLALAAHTANLPFAQVRAISNIVGDRSPSAWNIPAALAALNRITALMFAEK